METITNSNIKSFGHEEINVERWISQRIREILVGVFAEQENDMPVKQVGSILGMREQEVEESLIPRGADQKVFNDHGSNQFHDAANNPAMEHSLLDRLNETGVIDVNYQRKPRVRCDAKFSKLK